MSHILSLLAQSDTTVVHPGAGGSVIGGGVLILLFLVGIAAFVFWLWMLIDLLKSSKPSGEKILWAVLMVFLGFIGALLYYFIARDPGARTTV